MRGGGGEGGGRDPNNIERVLELIRAQEGITLLKRAAVEAVPGRTLRSVIQAGAQVIGSRTKTA